MNIKKDTEKMLKILVITAVIIIALFAIIKIFTKEVGLGVVSSVNADASPRTVTLRLYEQLEGNASSATGLIVGLKNKFSVGSVVKSNGLYVVTISDDTADINGIKAGQVARLTAVKVQ